MFLAEPPETPYDLRFWLGPIQVRVSPFFWLAAVLLGWSLCVELADSPYLNLNRGVLLMLWIAAVFSSILIHELGHAMAFRYYGVESYIVLYHFGGLAVPRSATAFGYVGRSKRDINQIVVSAAGPGAQLILAAIIIAVLYFAGFSVEPYRHVLPYLDRIIPEGGDKRLASDALWAVTFFLVYPSIMWAVINLLPVYPLDGGHIAREILSIFDPVNGIRKSLILSIVAGAVVALYAYAHHDPFLAIMFGLLAYSSFQVLQSYSGFGRW